MMICLVRTSSWLVLMLLLASMTACSTKKSLVEKSDAAELQLRQIARYDSGHFERFGAKMLAYDPTFKRLYVVNEADYALDVLDLSDPKSPQKMLQLNLLDYGNKVNGVAVADGFIAVVVASKESAQKGHLVLFDSKEFRLLTAFKVGYSPASVLIYPEKKLIIVANGGGPKDDVSVDSPGSISVINYAKGIKKLATVDLGFGDFEAQKTQLLEKHLHLSANTASLLNDLEPECLALDKHNDVVWVSLQENNALAKVDLNAMRIDSLLPLGAKDFQIDINGIDASDQDGLVNITGWPVFGLYQPRGIASIPIKGKNYLLSANQGKARDYEGFSEVARVETLSLDRNVSHFSIDIQEPSKLGRLKVTRLKGDSNGDGQYERLYAFGARSFSIFNAQGQMIFDSGNQFEKITARFIGENFNNSNRLRDGDSRSDDHGPEPVAIAVASLTDQTYAFIGLRQVGGIMIYNISDPYKPRFIDYVNTRNFRLDPQKVGAKAGDLGPVSILFIEAQKNTLGIPLLVVANEVSGNTTLYQVVLN